MRNTHALARVRFARAPLLAACFIAAPVLIAPAPASAQGLFEALFGRAPVQYAPPPIYSPPGLGARELRRATPKRITRESREPRAPREARRAKPRIEVAAKPAPYVPPPEMPGPLGKFLRDPSLRQGDVVSTEDGLMVFRGSAGSRHTAKDFVPVSQSASLVGKKTRAELAQLDKAVRLRSSSMIIAANDDKSGEDAPIVAQDESRRIR